MRRECERTWRRTRGTPRAEATPPLRDVDALLFFVHVFPLTTQRHLTRPDPTAATLRSDSYLCSDHTPENIAGFCSSGSHQDTSWVNIPGSLIGKIQKDLLSFDFFVFCESDECLMETDWPNVRLTWPISCFHVCRNVSVSWRLMWTDEETKKPADMQEESQLALSKVIPERRSPFCPLVC